MRFRRVLALAAVALATGLPALAQQSPSAQQDPDAQQDPAALLAAAMARLAPDRRTTVFDVVPQLQGNRLTLRGKVHDATLHQQLLAFLREHSQCEVFDELQVLPDPALGERTQGIVSVSVANLRSTPAHAAELGTQALLGMPLQILEQKGDWLLVQTPNHYLCWTQDRVAVMDQAGFAAWQQRQKVIVTATFAVVRAGEVAASEPVSDAVAGCILGLDRSTDAGYQVRYPDGRSGWLLRAEAEPLDAWLAHAEATPERIVATARRFLGVPYLWGGTSTKAMDCSGFTSTVYLLNGALLPRDADQQAVVGIEVEAGWDMQAVQPGDLLFFGSAADGDKPERVRHVGISLGGARCIHASVDVRINSLDPKAADFSASLRRSLLHVRRMIGPKTGVAQLRDIPYYRGS